MPDRGAEAAELARVLDRAERSVHDQPEQAARMAAECDAVAAERGWDDLRARAGYLRARVNAERGELDGALSLIEQARAWWAGCGQPLAALRTDLGRMQVLDDLGRHSETAAVGEALLAALETFECPDDQLALCRRLHATALNNLGATYSQSGDHERALGWYARAEQAYQELGLRFETAEPLANRGIGLLALGRPRQALEALRAASDLFAESGDRLWEAKCGGNIAQAHQQLGELVDALDVLRRSRATLEELDAHAEAVRIQVATAGVYLAAGLLPEAAAEAAGAVARTADLGLLHDNAVATFQLALAHLGAGRLDDAELELNRAAASFDAIGDRENWAKVLLAQADLAAQQNRGADAATRAGEAAAALRAGGWRIPLAWAVLRQVDLAVGEEAEDRLAGLAELVDEVQVPELRYAHGLRAARFLRRQDGLEPAEKLLRRAAEEVEQLGSALPDPLLRTAFRAERMGAHDALVELLVARGGPGDLGAACEVGDNAKAQTLIDMIAGTVGSRTADGAADASAAAATRLDRLRGDLSATYSAYTAATSAPQRAALRRQAELIEAELGALRLERAISATPGGRPVGDRVSGPPPGATLAYHVIGDSIVAFVLHGEAIEARALPGRPADVRRALDGLDNQWSRFRLGAAFRRRNELSLLATANDYLGELYGLLVAPVSDLLARIDGDEIAVVPHRHLHRVPFHALWDGSGYLNERWTIGLMPTVRRWRTPRSPADPVGRPTALVLGVADPTAPAIETEARAVAAALPGSHLVLGAAATIDVLAERLPGPPIVHLACHGLYRSGNPLFSSLRLGDRWLSTAEVLDLDLGGALVTLSACESGRHGRGTEPVGLAWAFLAAGARGAVVSQWIVDDGTTAELMASMYRQLGAGLSVPAALRRAQLEAAEEAPHPFHWAPFVHVGSPSVPPIGVPR